MQDRSLWPDLSSPTAATTSIFMIAALAAKERRHVVTMDIGSAYLNADMEGREVYMKLDKTCSDAYSAVCSPALSFLNDDGTLVVRLKKALYGCIQSSRLWYKHLRQTLVSIRFSVNAYDACVYNMGEGDMQVTLTLHVDDLMLSSCSLPALDEVIDKLEERYKTVKIVRELEHAYLGMQFDFTVPGKCAVSMRGFVDAILEDIAGLSTAVSPATELLHKVRDGERGGEAGYEGEGEVPFAGCEIIICFEACEE